MRVEKIDLIAYLVKDGESEVGYVKPVHDACKFLNTGDIIEIEYHEFEVEYKKMHIPSGVVHIVVAHDIDDTGGLENTMGIFEKMGFTKIPEID